MTRRKVWRGATYPLGATWDGQGVNFALFSEQAEGVELCLFDRPDAADQSEIIPLTERINQIWHGYVPGLRPGQLYGYRVHGPYRPEQGLRFNPAKLVLDAYAKAVTGPVRWDDTPYGYVIGSPQEDLSCDTRNSAGAMPKCTVIDPSFEWRGDRPPKVPWNRTIIYECHVKGMTMRHPGVPEHLRGTYLGLCTEPILEHLTALGVTSVELLPIHHSITSRHLAERGLTNYWGYDSIGFFAPDARFATRPNESGVANQVNEFKTMVRAFHAAGLEVILDVVYNHTPEGNHLGPTLAFKGIDNRAYYRLVQDKPRFYMDFSGTGNSLNMLHPRTLQLIMDSLRYWVTEMHVDGFRFDLAPVLARELYDVDRLSSFFDIVLQDPVLSQVKLIAEPWDVGPGGYQVGNFPVGWAEWNGKYRDTVRRFWKGDEGQIADLASRLSGSADIYQWTQRAAYASINFVVAHDGFTLRDLVSYERKHNEANGENNADGANDNNSRNWGVEGPTDDPAIEDMRYRTMRNFLATLAFSQGVPMLAHGDEIARTQGGNNNAYCQDNEITWLNWNLDERQRGLLEFARRVLAIRQDNPVLRRRTFFRGRVIDHRGVKDLTWLRADGQELTEANWREAAAHSLGMLIDGEATDETDEKNEPIKGDTMLLLVNASEVDVEFKLPPGDWRTLVDTTCHPQSPNGRYQLKRFSLVLLTLNPESSSTPRPT
ncbi:MAG TPA: glycogen debranching protein GlgX [Gemmatimonadales bacterium]|nr:glycogen debranching protein GlgX [Gemmatimonadales bacterium]